MVSQVLILREFLVLVQGQELKLALGLWAWLLWTGLGSLWGGWRAAREGTGDRRLSDLLVMLGLLLPATILVIRGLPGLGLLPRGQSLPLATVLLLSLSLLAPFGLVSGYFFARACRVLAGLIPQGAPGRVYYLETLGAGLGVLLLQLLLVGRVPSLGLGLAAGVFLALSPWFLDRPRAWARKLAASAVVLALGAGCLFFPRLEALSRGWQWPGRQVLAAVESPYALLTATREAEQTSFFANNLWQYTYPDPLTAEHEVQFGLLSQPHPCRVLLLGGGPGLLPEILKTESVSQVDYVELDPELVDLARRFLPGELPFEDSRVRIIYQDARRFLEQECRRYDVILMVLPEPKSAQLNRFYTREFFQLAAARLLPGGVFSFSLTGAATSLHPLRAAYLAMAYHTLEGVFPEAAALPGERVRFLASLSPGTLSADPETLVRRLKERRLPLQYVREYYLLQDLSRERRDYLHTVLSRLPVETNTDLKPGCYFYEMVLSAVQEGLPVNRALLFLKGWPPSLAWGALAAALLLPGVLVRQRRRGLALYQVMVMGMGAMALEILVLILFQLRFGHLYRQLGLLIAAFMAGMAGGSAAGARRAGSPGAVRLLAGSQAAMGGLAGLLALWLTAGLSGIWPEYLALAGYALILAAAGFAGGGIFALSAPLWSREQGAARSAGGFLYAMDLLGATLGTLLVSLLILPVWGILPTLYLLTLVHAAAGLLALAAGPGAA